MTSDFPPWAGVPAEALSAAVPVPYQSVAERISALGVGDARIVLMYEMTSEGLRAAVVETHTGRTLADRIDPTVSPKWLDRAVAEHLITLDRVARPDTPDWAGELIDLLPDVRARLAGSPGAFAMGDQYVAMFRVAHDDLAAAWAPHRAAAATLGRLAVADLPPTARPVAAVVIGSGCDQWPGLLGDALAEFGLPVGHLAYGRTNGTVGVHAIEQDCAGAPNASLTRGGPATGMEDFSMTPDGPRYYVPPILDAPRPGTAGRRLDRRLVVGAGAVGVSAVIGAVIVATPWIGGSPDSVPAQAAATSDVPASHSAGQPTTPTARPPLNLREARAPIVAYAAPTLAPTQKYTRATPSPAPRRRPAPPPAPRHRTIPNPIPGLPPIVLP